MPRTSFENDIFISYSHIDNEESSARKIGWVQKFYNELDVLLRRSTGTRETKIWWDSERLAGNIVFDDAIVKAIEKSAMLLCLNSPSFLNAEYCQKELKWFFQKASGEPYGLKPNNKFRILNLLLFNIPPAEWPEELSGAAGFKFNNAKGNVGQGDTLEIGKSKFRKELLNLRDAIISLMREFQPDPGLLPTPVTPDPDFHIYFGEVSDGLRSQRDRTINDLGKKGFKICPNVPPPFDSAQHEKAVIEQLETANLNVHLLDQFKGRPIEGENLIAYPQKQLELSMKVNKPKIIWVPEEIDINAIDEENYRTFLRELDAGKNFSEDISYIRGKKSRLTQEISDLAEVVKERTKQIEPEANSVLLDIHYEDASFITNLWANLFKEKIQTFLNPQEGDPMVNFQSLKERIRQVKNLVFFYSENSKDWVRERFIAAKQYLIDINAPVKKFLFFLLPPEEDPAKISSAFEVPKINVINNSFSSQLQAEALNQLLDRIKARS